MDFMLKCEDMRILLWLVVNKLNIKMILVTYLKWKKLFDCTDKPFTCQLSMTDIMPYLKFKADIKSLTIRSCLMLSQSMGFLNSVLVTLTGSPPRFHNWEHFQLLEKMKVGPFPYKLLCSISKHNPSSFYSHKDCMKRVIVNIGYDFN